MGESNSNPYQSPEVTRHAAGDRIQHATDGRWQIVTATVLTYVLSGAFLMLAMLLLFLGITSIRADGVYINDIYFMGPDEVAWLIFGLFVAAACSLVLSGLTFLAAVGLQKRRKWGWQLAMGLALLPWLPILLVPEDFTLPLIPWGAYGVFVLFVLLQQKIRLQFQHGQAYAEEREA